MYCTSYQLAPPWRLYTALSISRPLHGGFVLHFLSVGPPRGGFILHFMLAGPSVEVFILHFLLLSPFVKVSYLLVGPWRPHTSLSISRPLRGGLALRFHQSASVEALYCIVLPFVMMTRKSVKGKHCSLTISVPTLLR
jgi:hypothetical protein